VDILDKDILEYALDHALTKRVEYAEARAHKVRQEQIILRNGALEAYVQSVDGGFNVRVLADGGLLSGEQTFRRRGSPCQ